MLNGKDMIIVGLMKKILLHKMNCIPEQHTQGK